MVLPLKYVKEKYFPQPVAALPQFRKHNCRMESKEQIKFVIKGIFHFPDIYVYIQYLTDKLDTRSGTYISIFLY